jgi:hypothetical protein
MIAPSIATRLSFSSIVRYPHTIKGYMTLIKLRSYNPIICTEFWQEFSVCKYMLHTAKCMSCSYIIDLKMVIVWCRKSSAVGLAYYALIEHIDMPQPCTNRPSQGIEDQVFGPRVPPR